MLSDLAIKPEDASVFCEPRAVYSAEELPLAIQCGGLQVADVDMAAISQAITAYLAGQVGPLRKIRDESCQKLSFNVMPGKGVEEVFTPNFYEAGDRFARAVFDRTYATEMDKSPSHVIFLSSLVQWQKLIYLMLCERLGKPYRSGDTEIFKIWPTEIHCMLPGMVREERALEQNFMVSKFETLGTGKWRLEGFSFVNDRLGFVGKALAYKIQ